MSTTILSSIILLGTLAKIFFTFYSQRSDSVLSFECSIPILIFFQDIFWGSFEGRRHSDTYETLVKTTLTCKPLEFYKELTRSFRSQESLGFIFTVFCVCCNKRSVL